ncbi:MAG: hypothetical protein PHZ02_04970 [Desulfocapsaceae bacterium]|nr:hypothetical protein [Desulfocapsaceae bacterium]
MNITKKINIFALYLPLALLLAPDQAWALQVHAPPEGIYVHQLAHLFFVAALSYLFWDVRRSAFPGKGWRYLQIFCILMILWNILAFSGHWLGFDIASSDIIHPAGYFSSRLIGPITSIKFIYFCATLDHLLSVPALFFLFLCMRSLYRSIETKEEK